MSKEIKTALIALAAIGLLVAGVNFLKGNSFFGGDDVYYAYFPNSAGVSPANSVMMNGVPVGKVMSVDLVPENDSMHSVLIKFNIQQDDFRIARDWDVTVGSVDLFNKGMIIQTNGKPASGYYESGDTIIGVVESDIITEVKGYVDPVLKKVQGMMNSVDKMVSSVNAFWDTSATSDIESSMNEVKQAIKRFGNVARDIEELVHDEKEKFSRIMSHVESITENLRKSNEQVTAVLGNVQKITDDLVTADFKGTIERAKETISKLNSVLADVESGKGTLGKLLKDEELYREIVNTNAELQNLVNDIQLHPERYIHFSVIGAKTKGVSLTTEEEKKLRRILDTTKISN